MIALIDADIVAYRTAAVSEGEVLEIAEGRCNELMHRILHDVGATEYQSFLSGSDNFRVGLYPEYKAHRKDKPKPKWLEHLKEHLIVKWNSKISTEVEADDDIGIASTEYWTSDVPCIVCSIDKDLKQLPGKHFNFVKQTFDFVTPLDGAKQFYKQMLIGDSSDNVKGVEGIGEKKAERIISPLDNELDMYERVYDMYQDHDKFMLTAQLLWILKKEKNPLEVHHHFRTLLQQEAESQPSSLPISQNRTDPGLDVTS